MSSPKLQQHNAHELRAGYSNNIRRFEVSCIGVYFALMAALSLKLWPFLRLSPWLMLAAATSGYIAADFVSGFVHWAADTWGAIDMPLIGKALIRPFREHHVDQEAITHHDFVETNGNNCGISIVPLIIAVSLSIREPGSLNLFISTFIGSLVLWVLGTNQFHKWSHMREPPPFVGVLQKLHLVLPPEHHAIHHRAPFDRYYCITTGWLNWLLHVTRFFRISERVVTITTGLLPRRDDIGEYAALQIAREQNAEPIEPASKSTAKI